MEDWQLRRIILITGATSGLGYAMAAALAHSRYELILTYRDHDKGTEICNKLISADPEAKIRMVALDLSSFKSIDAFAQEISRDYDWIDVLFNNAGLYMDVAQKTAEGFEMTVGVNYLGPYYLTRKLMPLIKRGHQPQIIQMCSFSALLGKYRDRAGIFEHHPHGYRAYLNSKLMQLMMTLYFADELKASGITVNAVNPGVVATGIWKGKSFIMRLLTYKNKERYASAKEAAQAGLYLIENESIRNASGKFFKNQGQQVRLGKRFFNKRWLKSLIDRSDEAISNWQE
jgi:NAD(P)-dependent dehydrogenase (short-subunit alcohol dehydrogenase family)